MWVPSQIKVTIFIYVYCLSCGLISLFGCETHPPSHPKPLIHIETIFPKSATPLDRVRLEGYGFGIEGEDDGIWISGIRVPIEYWTQTTIDFIVPDTLNSGAHIGVIRANNWVSPPFNLYILE